MMDCCNNRKESHISVLLHLSKGQLSMDTLVQGTLVQEDFCSKETLVQRDFCPRRKFETLRAVHIIFCNFTINQYRII